MRLKKVALYMLITKKKQLLLSCFKDFKVFCSNTKLFTTDLLRPLVLKECIQLLPNYTRTGFWVKCLDNYWLEWFIFGTDSQNLAASCV